MLLKIEISGVVENGELHAGIDIEGSDLELVAGLVMVCQNNSDLAELVCTVAKALQDENVPFIQADVTDLLANEEEISNVSFFFNTIGRGN